MRSLSANFVGRVARSFYDDSRFLKADRAGGDRNDFDDSARRRLYVPLDGPLDAPYDGPYDWSIEGPFGPHNPSGGVGAFLPDRVG